MLLIEIIPGSQGDSDSDNLTFESEEDYARWLSERRQSDNRYQGQERRP